MLRTARQTKQNTRCVFSNLLLVVYKRGQSTWQVSNTSPPQPPVTPRTAAAAGRRSARGGGHASSLGAPAARAPVALAPVAPIAFPTMSAVQVVVAPNAKVPKLTQSILKDADLSVLYVRQIEDLLILYKVLEGIETKTNGDAKNVDAAASAAGYIWQSVLNGDVSSFQNLFRLDEYSSRGDLMWAEIKPVLTNRRVTKTDQSGWSECKAYLDRPKFEEESMVLLSMWEIQLKANFKQATQLASGVDGRTAPASEEEVIQTIMNQRGCLPSWADNDTYVRSKVESQKTFKTFIAELESAHKSVAPDDDDDKVSAVHNSAKTQAECNFFAKTGRCKYGDKCKFKHVAGGGTSQSSQSAAKPRKPCYKFRDTGACEFGDKCRFSHGAAGGNATKKKTWVSNPLGADGEPTVCEQCGSMFHLSAKCKKPGEQRIAAIESSQKDVQQTLLEICKEMQGRVQRLEKSAGSQPASAVAAVAQLAEDDRSAESAMSKFLEEFSSERIAAVEDVKQ